MSNRKHVRHNGWPPGLSVPEIQGLRLREYFYAISLRHELMNAASVGGLAGAVFAEREQLYMELS
jgi:hypothetical protein